LKGSQLEFETIVRTESRIKSGDVVNVMVPVSSWKHIVRMAGDKKPERAHRAFSLESCSNNGIEASLIIDLDPFLTRELRSCREAKMKFDRHHHAQYV
jgi:hypothetical protein